MVLNNADGLTASAEAAVGRGWAMGLSRGKQSRGWEQWSGHYGTWNEGRKANYLEGAEEEA